MSTPRLLLRTIALAVVTGWFGGCASAQPAGAGGGAGASAPAPGTTATASPAGYYRTPAIAGDTLLFCAEGDIWSAPLTGGRASRLTSHPGEETLPVVSPDGTTIAFAAQYEGPQEVYTMPIAGGLPVRRTYYGGRSVPAAWGSLGEGGNTGGSNTHLIVATRRYSTLPDTQLAVIDTTNGAVRLLPLAQAAEAGLDDHGDLFFTRPDFQGSHTRRYKGGTAQKIWRLDAPAPGAEAKEATALTADYDGTSASAMWFDGRVYFRSDRSGVMNIWSMAPDGRDVRQVTTHDDYEVKTPSLGVGPDGKGRIAYQHGADIWVLDLATGKTAPVPLSLETDLDQTRERWIDKPMGMVTAAHLSADGQRVAITARGQVFVAPRKYGRLVEADRHPGVRYRDARFMPGDNGGRLLTLSDESGEVEIWTLPSNGVGDAAQLSTGAEVLRWEAVPSPDGKLIAHHDKNQRLWILDVATKASRQIDENPVDAFTDLSWSPDSRWLAYSSWAPNLNQIVKLYDTRSGKATALTSDRTSSSSPAWGSKGDFLYFLSERNLESVVGSPWGTLQPEPFFDKRMKVYGLALRPGLRSPFEEPNELTAADKKAGEEPKKDGDKAKQDGDKAAATPSASSPPPPSPPPSPAPVEIDLDGIADRVYETPVPPGNYRDLSVNDKAFFLTAYEASAEDEPKAELLAFAIDEDALKKREWKVETVAGGVEGYELSLDGKSLLIRTADKIAVVDAAPAKVDDLGKQAVDLSGWKLTIEPREEWRQMYDEAWRLHRDYFYDRHMHGVDWVAMKAKYAPLAERVACRGDLSDVLGQLIAELSALHHFVVGGDLRKGPEHVAVATLGADLVRDEGAGGYRIREVYLSDPDRPELLSPLARPGLDIRAGDVITMIDGRKTLSSAGVSEMLRNKAGKQVLIHTVRNGGAPAPNIVVPIDMQTDAQLRYRQWELERRAMVEEQSRGQIGYIHLRTMGTADMADFARQYYPLFMRQGLIIDVRHNGGGNIDSWVLSRLMRKAWFYWQGRVGEPTWNMPYAFRGHMVVLCDEKTGSDGEAFSEGFRRLGLGKVIGTRTWGGEIWLSFSNYLVDRGIASAAEVGVYGPEGHWLIEGRGVEPDIVVDNLPVATFNGGDAQLETAIHTLQQQIKDHPVEVPPVPKYPNKSWKP